MTANKQSETARKEASLSTEEQLALAIEALSEHVVLFDAEDRIVLANRAWRELNKEVAESTKPGARFEDHLRALIEKGLLPEATGREEEWLRERMERHLNPSGPFEVARQDGRWIRLYEQRLPNDGIILIISDITESKRVDQALLESEARFRAVVDNSPTKIHIKDAEGRYTLVNPLAEKLFGFTDEEARGKTSYDIFPKEIADAFTAHDRQVAESREMAEQVEHFTLEDGERTYLTVKFPILDAQGEVTGIAAIGTDITERKRAEAINTRLGRIVEQSVNEIFMFDAQTLRFIQVNRGARENLGYSMKELHELTPFDIKPDYTEELFEELISPLLNRTSDQIIFETIHKRKDGSVYDVEVRLQLMHTETPPLFVANIQDITKRKLTEEALRESEHALQERVVILEEAQCRLERQGEDLVRLAGDLKMARDEAAAANRTKSEFLANMSHELRTPLNAILGFSEMMGNATLGPLGNPKYQEYAKDINDSGRHLLALIQDILDLSKIEAGKLELDEEDIDIARTIRSCMVLVKERARNGGVKLKTDIADGLPALHADQRKLKQILVNLLSNAVKFTPAGGTVTIKAWCKADSGYVFQVIDTGIGMALADIPTALSPFGQVDSQFDRKYEGTGLGLPLTKSLAEMHGGSLDLQSEEGIGTTVTVRFPSERIVYVSGIEATGTPGA